ncbi:carboxymuconolactone decarboxylase family protein [Lysinibacillus sp. SGAir0095]|uniref:carboxymuconolactone decarboxylase family protein n=1 Tax=Lysinibacillus sp. SGAir0095 TaxID=2070463 RepID=UPI001F10F219|nr:carboxymuconolactone decarboxylase family protein [Lysinibacillus sp. SGAir0095]
MELNAGNQTEAALIKYKKGLGVFNEKMPGFVSQFNAFTEECFKDGAITQKQKHLIALGISIHAQDEYCIIYHTKGCLDHGCSEQEIIEAIGVTAALGGGPSLSQGVTLVLDCMNEMNHMKQ